MYGMRFRDDGAWIIGHNDDDAIFAMGARACPRAALRMLYRACAVRKPPSLDALADNVGALDPAQWESLRRGDTIPDVWFAENSFAARNDLLRFWAGLTSAQRQKIRRGCALGGLGLPAGMRRELLKSFQSRGLAGMYAWDQSQDMPGGLSGDTKLRLTETPSHAYWLAYVRKDDPYPPEARVMYGTPSSIYLFSKHKEGEGLAFRSNGWDAVLTVAPPGSAMRGGGSARAAYVDPKSAQDVAKPDAALAMVIEEGRKDDAKFRRH
jgi:hypothetical protein